MVENGDSRFLQNLHELLLNYDASLLGEPQILRVLILCYTNFSAINMFLPRLYCLLMLTSSRIW